jgi:O-antigen ligase
MPAGKMSFSFLAAIFLAGGLSLLFLLSMQVPLLWAIPLGAGILTLSWGLVYLGGQHLYFALLAFLMPFSLESEIAEGILVFLPTEIMLLPALVMLFFEWLRNPALFRSLPAKEFRWLLPFLLAFLLTLPFSTMPFVSLKFSLVNLGYLLVFFFYLAILIRRKPAFFHQLILLYTLALFAVSLWSVYRFWQWDWNPVVVRGIFRPFYKDHTLFAAVSALLGLYWLARGWQASSLTGKVGGILTGLICVGLVLLSNSRAGLLSLGFGGMVFLMLRLHLRPKHLLIGMLGLGIVLFSQREALITRMQQVTAISYDSHADLLDRTRSVGNISTDASNLERLNRWTAAWGMFQKKPWTGFGPGTYQFNYLPYQDSAFYNPLTVRNPYDIPENSGGTAHSEYLLAMSEMGISGLAAWLFILGRWTWLAFRRRQGPQRKEAVIAFTALATYLFHALVNNFLTTDKFAFLFWGMAAWLVVNASPYEENTLLQTD